MGRLDDDFLERIESFSNRAVVVAEAIEKRRVAWRIVDQLVGSGTSVGANTFEADEAVSRKDFCKSLGTVLKELNETRFWVRIIGRRGWLPQSRLAPLEAECVELKRIVGAMLSRTRRNDARRSA